MSKFEPPVFSKNWKGWRHFSGLGSERVGLKYSPGSYHSKSVTNSQCITLPSERRILNMHLKQHFEGAFWKKCSRDGFRDDSLVCDRLGILGIVFILDWWWPTRFGTEINSFLVRLNVC